LVYAREALLRLRQPVQIGGCRDIYAVSAVELIEHEIEEIYDEDVVMRVLPLLIERYRAMGFYIPDGIE